MSRAPLQTLLAEARGGVLLFGITPPRRSATPERIREIAEVTLDRLAGLDLDGLILYDIDDLAAFCERLGIGLTAEIGAFLRSGPDRHAQEGDQLR